MPSPLPMSNGWHLYISMFEVQVQPVDTFTVGGNNHLTTCMPLGNKGPNKGTVGWIPKSSMCLTIAKQRRQNSG